MINFRQIVRIAASVPLLWGAVACSDTVFDRTEDPEALPGDRAATIEVPLRLHPEKPKVIGKPLVNDIPSRAEAIMMMKKSLPIQKRRLRRPCMTYGCSSSIRSEISL